MKMMSNKECVSSIVLMRKLFLWIFWEYILILSKIILGYHSWLNELSCFYFHEVLVIFCCTNCSWSNASRRDTCLNLLDNCLNNWNTWISEDMVYPLSLGELDFSFALQYYANWQWCLDLWGCYTWHI